MTMFRDSLPQLRGDFFLTDGGIETTLIFLEGIELPEFAAFTLLRTEDGRAALHRYFRAYAGLAGQFGTGLVLESATWRASSDWGAKLGYGAKQMRDANHESIALLEEVRRESGRAVAKTVVSGCVGPRGDGYNPTKSMSVEEAEKYHRDQIEVFQDTAADMVTAITMNYVEEALGITKAARRAGMPVAISFTVETDGRLPTGQALHAAIKQVDAETSCYPSYYMINCAHPTHFGDVLAAGQPWSQRIRGLRANASRKSHAELNESPELDIGDPTEFGQQHAQLKRVHSQLNVMGGCCGTDHRHIEQIAMACSPLFRGERPGR
jgi:S-methylmethionine-dependent homocysteine/selenocysteine methylase